MGRYGQGELGHLRTITFLTEACDVLFLTQPTLYFKRYSREKLRTSILIF